MLSLCEKPFVAFSGGKDSTVVSHLVRKIRPDILHVFYDYRGCNHLETETFLERCIEGGMNLLRYSQPSHIDVFKETGLIRHHTHRHSREYRKRVIARPWRELLKEYGFDGSFTGLRARESGGRLSLLRSMGKKFFNKKDQMWQFMPLGWWSTEEIWMFIDATGVDYNTLYDTKLKFIDRLDHESRVSNWTLTTKINEGQIFWTKYFHLDLYHHLIRELPEAGLYV